MATAIDIISTVGLKGYWSFDGNTNDLSGNGNNFTAGGSSTLTIDKDSIDNNAYKGLGSSTGYFYTSNPLTSSGLRNRNFSVSLWYYDDGSNVGGDWIPLFAFGTLGVSPVISLVHNAGNSNLAAVYGGTSVDPFPIVTGWHNIIVTHIANTNNLKLYLDGSYLFTHANFGKTDNPASFIMGKTDNSGQRPNAKIDEVRLYERVISDSEVLSLYQNGVNPVTVYNPVITPTTGTYTTIQTASITSTTPGSSIYYTLDSSIPNNTKTLYSTPFQVLETSTIKAIAYKNGMANSDIVTETLTINLPHIIKPTANIPSGTYETSKNIYIDCQTSGVEIYYTTDNSEPTILSSRYTESLTIENNTTIKIRAFKTNYLESDILTLEYIIIPKSNKKRLLPNLNKIFKNDKYILFICNGIDLQLEETDKLLEKIRLNMFFDTIEEDLGILIIANTLGLSLGENLTTNEKRSIIEAKWKSKGKTSEEMLQTIANSWRNGEVTVTFENGIIAVRFSSIAGVPSDILSLQDALNKIRPAHLLIDYMFNFLYWNLFESWDFTWTQFEGKNLNWNQLEIQITTP